MYKTTTTNIEQKNVVLSGELEHISRQDIVAVAGKTERGKDEYWLGCVLENMEEELQVQWFDKITPALYQLSETTATISKETVICSGLHMKHMWNYNDVGDKSIRTWKLMTTMETIVSLHNDKMLHQNNFRGCPTKRENKHVQTLLWD